MSFRFVGIGDPHFDGKMKQHIPDFNQFVLGEIEKCCLYAVENGITYIVILGDIADKPLLSNEASKLLLDLFHRYPNLIFIMYPGNHDRLDDVNHSLVVLRTLSQQKKITNLKVYDEPTTLLANTENPIRILPWPHFDVDPDCLNFVHIETNGSQWDHGKAVDSERDTEAWVVSGHLHTKQRCGPRKNIIYPGTLYQTSFGEREDKWFIDGTWDGNKLTIDYVPNIPKYICKNIVISDKEDLKGIDSSPYILYKAFVKIGADISAHDLKGFPNVVKVNTFKTRQEFQALVSEELFLEELGQTVSLTTIIDALEKYMVRAGASDELRTECLESFNFVTQQLSSK